MGKAGNTTPVKTSWSRKGLLLEDFTDVLSQAGQDLFSPSAYDTAWVARIDEGDDPRASAFPQALTWLSHHQNEDGSWGEGETAEKLLSTLAAITALTEKSRRPSDGRQVEVGLGYIWRCLHRFQPSQSLPVGFELLIGTLVDEARRFNLNVPEQLGAHYQAYREQKCDLLRQIPSDQLSSSSVIFSIEFMLTPTAGYGDTIRSELFVQSNGSVGISPSATAAMIKYVRDPRLKARMLNYLTEIAIPHRSDDSLGWSNIGNSEIFEMSWVLYNLKVSGCQHAISLQPAVHRLLEQIAGNWSDTGVAPSQFFPVADGDTSSVAYIMLDEYGRTANATGKHQSATAAGIDVQAFDRYWKQSHMATYPLERDPSVSTNVHGLEVFARTGHRGRVDQILDFLRESKQGNPFWLDKWHASPYYTTTHVIMAICAMDSELSAPALSWIIDTQHRNGGWGYKAATAEETAYAIQAIVYYARGQGWTSKLRQAVKDGARFLHQSYRPFSLETPALWIAKNFYNPYLIVHSAVLAALLLIESLDYGFPGREP